MVYLIIVAGALAWALYGFLVLRAGIRAIEGPYRGA